MSESSGGNEQKQAFEQLHSALGVKKRFAFSLPPFKFPWGLVRIVAALVILGPVVMAALYRVVDPPGTLLMVQRWLGGEHIRHVTVKYSDISPNIIRAVLAAEDARFCEHKGFDVEAIQAAYASNMKTANQPKATMRGGSTISQQTSKNLFLWPQRDFIRKGMETYYTFLIELMYPKERIMQHYLNIAEWGDGVFGIQAASQARFKVSAGQLSPRQAALLAAVLPSPNKWSATNPGPYVRRRAATIQARMYAISAQGLDSCVISPSAPKPARPRGAPSTLAPLPALPPDVALEAEAPVMIPEGSNEPAAIDPMTVSTFGDGEADGGADEAAPAAEETPVPVESAAPPP